MENKIQDVGEWYIEKVDQAQTIGRATAIRDGELLAGHNDEECQKIRKQIAKVIASSRKELVFKLKEILNKP